MGQKTRGTAPFPPGRLVSLGAPWIYPVRRGRPDVPLETGQHRCLPSHSKQYVWSADIVSNSRRSCCDCLVNNIHPCRLGCINSFARFSLSLHPATIQRGTNSPRPGAWSVSTTCRTTLGAACTGHTPSLQSGRERKGRRGKSRGRDLFKSSPTFSVPGRENGIAHTDIIFKCVCMLCVYHTSGGHANLKGVLSEPYVQVQ